MVRSTDRSDTMSQTLMGGLSACDGCGAVYYMRKIVDHEQKCSDVRRDEQIDDDVLEQVAPGGLMK